MFERSVYNAMKGLVGALEDRLERLEKETVSHDEAEQWGEQAEKVWAVLCRRQGERARGPYKRRFDHSIIERVA